MNAMRTQLRSRRSRWARPTRVRRHGGSPFLNDPRPNVRDAARWRFAYLAGKREPDEAT